MESSQQEKTKWHDLYNAMRDVEIVFNLLQKKFDFNSSDGSKLVEEAKTAFKLIRAQVEAHDPKLQK